MILDFHYYPPLHFQSLIITPIGSLGPIQIPCSFKLRCGVESQSKTTEPCVQLEHKLTTERSYKPLQFELLNSDESQFSYAADTHPGTQTHNRCSSINIHNQPPDHNRHAHCYLSPPAASLPPCAGKTKCNTNHGDLLRQPQITAGQNPLVAPIIIQTEKTTPQKVRCKQVFQQPHNLKQGHDLRCVAAGTHNTRLKDKIFPEDQSRIAAKLLNHSLMPRRN